MKVGRWLSQHLSRVSFQTFIVDPPLLIVFGAIAIFLATKVFKKIKLAFWLCFIVQLALWGLGTLMYFDYPPLASKGLDNDFMWNGYIDKLGLVVVNKDQVPTYNSPLMNFLAILGWLSQPLFLYLGVKLGKSLIQKTK